MTNIQIEGRRTIVITPSCRIEITAHEPAAPPANDPRDGFLGDFEIPIPQFDE